MTFSYVTEENTNYDQPAFSNDEKSKLINNFIKNKRKRWCLPYNIMTCINYHLPGKHLIIMDI